MSIEVQTPPPWSRCLEGLVTRTIKAILCKKEIAKENGPVLETILIVTLYSFGMGVNSLCAKRDW